MQYQVGRGYDYVEGVKKDYAMAAKFYEQTADLVEAYKWLELARFASQASSVSQKVKWTTRGALDELVQQMTDEQFLEGERRAHSLSQTH